jgi:hypothetical protein
MFVLCAIVFLSWTREKMFKIEFMNGCSESINGKDSEGKIFTIQIWKFVFQIGFYRED